MGIFTKIDITISYGIGITKLFAHQKYCYEGYVMTSYRVYFGLSTISSSYDLQKGTQASWYRLVQLSRLAHVSLCVVGLNQIGCVV